MNTCALSTVTALACAIFTPLLNAAELGVQLSSRSEHTDNALKARGQNSSSEWQTYSTLAVEAEQQGEAYQLSMEYDFTDRHFWKDSQPDEQEYTGRAAANWEPHRLLGISLEQRRQQLIANSTARDLSSNEDTRDTLVIQLDSLLQLRSNTDLQLSPYWVDASYDSASNLTASQDSNRTGIRGVLTNRLNRSSETGLSLDAFTAEFDDGFEYDSRRAELFYRSGVRQLQYQLSIGRNTVDVKNGESEDATSYSLLGRYTTGATSITARASQLLSDSSAGSSLQDSESGATTGTDLSAPREREGGGENSVVKYRNYSLELRSTALCSRCLSTFTATDSDEEHQNNPDDSLEEQRYTLSLGYDITSDINITATIMQLQASPASEADYDESRWDLELDWTPFSRTRFFIGAGYEERDGDLRSLNYQEYVGSLGFEVTLL